MWCQSSRLSTALDALEGPYEKDSIDERRKRQIEKFPLTVAFLK